MEQTTVLVTQFMRPNGRKVAKWTRISTTFEPFYESMKEAGCQLQAEVLSTKEVSLTITNDETDLDIRVVPNDSAVQQAICDLLQDQSWLVEGERKCSSNERC